MNVTTHPATPEEIMAYLDGELSASETQSVSSHLNTCTECARVAAEFRKTSQDLTGWVAAGPATCWEDFVLRTAKSGSAHEAEGASIRTRISSWKWKQWTIAGGATVAALYLLLIISMPNLLRSRVSPLEIRTYLQPHQKPGRTSGNVPLPPPPHSQPNPTFGSVPDKSNVSPSDAYEYAAPDNATDSPASSEALLNRAKDDSSHADASPTPMIARTISLAIVSKDFAASRVALDTILMQHHGYAGALNINTPENAPQNLQASLRIPVGELASALTSLKALGRVENESQSGEEVTQQHTDLVARLQNSRDTEQRLRGILEERTGKISDILQVENEISRVRGDIERMEAEQKDLEHRVDFATIELQITEEYKAQLDAPAASVSTRLHNSLVTGIHDASEMALDIALFFAENGPTLLIWLVILAAPALLLWRRYKRNLAAN